MKFKPTENTSKYRFIHKTVEYDESDDTTYTEYTFLKPLQVSLKYQEMTLHMEDEISSITLTTTDDKYYRIHFNNIHDEYDLMHMTTETIDKIEIIIHNPPTELSENENLYRNLLWLRDNLQYHNTYGGLKEVYQQFIETNNNKKQ